MKDYPESVALVEAKGFQVIKLDVGGSNEAGIERLLQRPEKTLVFDLPDSAEKPLRLLKHAGRKVVVLDDLGGRHFDADIVINGSIAENALEYPERHAGYRLGPDYCVLGPDFDDKRNISSGPAVVSILVSFGGSDPKGLTVKAARVLSKMDIPAAIHFIMGPGFGDEEELRRFAGKNEGTFHIHHDVEDLAAMMLEADLAIASAGLTAYELAATGTPALLIPSIDHERPVAKALEAKGCALMADGIDSETFGGLLSRLVEYPELRQRMSLNGPALIDGLGRKRNAGILAE